MSLNNYPAPISISYNEAESTENIQLKFRAIIKTFGICLKYCSLLIISDYLNIREKKLLVSNELDKLFIEKIERPSLGHWNNFIRSILMEFRGKSDLLFIPELFDFYFKDTGGKKLASQKVVKAIDELIFIRNKFVHPDIYPSDEDAVKEYDSFKLKLDLLLDKLSFLQNYPLIKYLHEEKREILCLGNKMEPGDLEQRVSFYIRSKDDSKEELKLDLGRFFYSHSRSLTQDHPVLLYETMMGKRLKYISGNYYLITEGDEIEDYNPLKEMRTLIDILSVNLDRGTKNDTETNISSIKASIGQGSIDWDIFQELSVKISDKVYDKFIKEGKFSYKLFVERKKIDEEFKAFVLSDKQGFGMVAESGLGKTNVFCSWERKLLNEGHAVFMFYGREYDGSDIGELILNHLGMNDSFFRKVFKNSFKDLLEIASKIPEIKKEGKRFIILIDAVNEFDYPEVLMDKIMAFIETFNYPWLKIVFNIRTFVWESLYDKYLFNSKLFHMTTEGSISQALPYIKLSAFSELELKEAFTQYKEQYKLQNSYDKLSASTRKFLSNPLLLRYASEAYNGERLPTEIFTSKIFEQYKNERINKKDYFFLDYLTESMIALKNDDVMFKYFCNEGDPELSEQNNVLNIKSILSDNNYVLREKIADYIFAEPVYEKNLIPVCGNTVCQEYNIELPLEYLINEESGKRGNCPNCGKEVNQLSVDLRTTFTRLQSENIIQEFEKEGDQSIRFTYDRLFEFFVGKHFQAYTLNNFEEERGKILFPLVQSLSNNHIFWGGIKNVLLDYLRNESIGCDFWYKIFIYDNHEETGQLSSEIEIRAYQQIISAPLIDFYSENPGRANQILLYITDEKRVTGQTIKLALECIIHLLAEAKELNLQSDEVEILRRGLRFSDDEIILEASRIIASLYSNNREMVLELFAEVSSQIKSCIKIAKLPLLIIPKHQKALSNSLEGFSNLILILLGQHYSDKDTRERIFSMGNQLIDPKIFRFIKRALAKFVPMKVTSIYYEKGFPCNYIEMYLNIISNSPEISEDIGRLFIEVENTKLVDYKDKIFKYSQIENGLISWYLYSLIPIYGQIANQREDVLDLIKVLYENGNQTSKYIAQKSLWILAEFAELDSEVHNSLFEEYSEDFLNHSGGYIVYHHKCDLDQTLTKYLERKDKEDQSKVYWSKYEDGILSFTYDDSIIKDLAEYLIRNKDISRFDFIINLLEGNYLDDRKFMFHSIMTIGQLGSLTNPTPALKTLEYIIEKYSSDNQEYIFLGKKQSIKNVLVEALLNIKSYYPKQVLHFIDSLEPEDRNILIEVNHKEVKKRTDYLASYYGEVIYQKTFLFEPEARKIFGRGIVQSGKAQNVEDLFSAYVLEFLDWLKVIKNCKKWS